MGCAHRGLVLLIAAALAGCGGSASPGPVETTPANPGSGNPANQRLADAIARKLGDGILEVRLGAPPDAALDVHPYASPWMYVTVTTLGDVEGVRPKFDAILLAGAYNSRAAAAGAQVATGLSLLTPETPGCSPSPNSRSCRAEFATVFGVDVGDPRAWVTSEAEIRRQVAERLGGSGLQAESIGFEYPTAYPVPLVVVRTFEPGTEAVFGPDPQYEGYYVEVVDAQGRPAIAGAVSNRMLRGVSGRRADVPS
jgi:hypothetical protein